MRFMPLIPAFFLAGGVAFGEEHGGKVDWIRNPAFGLAKARLEGKAVILYFTATW